MKKIILFIAACLAALFCGCVNEAPSAAGFSEEKLIVVGFSQVGAESEWRVANTESMKAALSEENGYELIFDDGRNKAENQIRAIRTFIQQEVDYIVLSPIVETGWDSILKEAKEAGIPVIVTDRYIDTGEEELYAAYIGSDFRKEGEIAVEWLEKLIKKQVEQKILFGSFTYRERWGPLHRSAERPRWKRPFYAIPTGDWLPRVAPISREPRLTR